MTMLTLAIIDEMVAAAKLPPVIRPTAAGQYVMLISDDMRAYLVMLDAKDRWKARYRAERMARRGA